MCGAPDLWSGAFAVVFLWAFKRHAGWPRISSGARSRLPFAALSGASAIWMAERLGSDF